jgi:hypothetical protein
MLQFALSIRQPWAWAIIHAGKDIENRSWLTTFRGRFFIHAAKGLTRSEYDDFIAFTGFTGDRFRFVFPGGVACPPAEELQRGGIIGEAELIDCVREHSSPWFIGKYGFVLRNARPLPFRPLRGELGFFVVEPEVQT